MNLMTFILTVTIIWIILFFLAAPYGIKMPKEVKKGNADSAPEVHYITEKVIITLIISVVIAGVYWYIFYVI